MEIKLLKLKFYKFSHNCKYNPSINTCIIVSILKYKYKYICMYSYLKNRKILNFKNFIKKYNLKNDTMNESQLQKFYNYSIYPRDFKIHSDKGFVNIDNGSMRGSFIVKDNKSYYFDSFGGSPDKFLLNQSPKPIIYHNYKVHHINSQLCGTYCLYFFYLIERMTYYDAILKMYFYNF